MTLQRPDGSLRSPLKLLCMLSFVFFGISTVNMVRFTETRRYLTDFQLFLSLFFFL